MEVSLMISPRRLTKLSLSLLSLNIFLRSIPLTMICCRAPGASILALRGIGEDYQRKGDIIKFLFHGRPHKKTLTHKVI